MRDKSDNFVTKQAVAASLFSKESPSAMNLRRHSYFLMRHSHKIKTYAELRVGSKIFSLALP